MNLLRIGPVPRLWAWFQHFRASGRESDRKLTRRWVAQISGLCCSVGTRKRMSAMGH